MMKNLNTNAKLLIVIHSLHSVIELFINTFLVAYFLHITQNNIVPASLFYVFTYALLGLSFTLLGSLIKSGNQLLLYRIGFVLNAAILLLIVYLKEDITLYVWLLGLASGLEKALFYFPQNMMTADENPGESLIKFNGYRYGWNGAIKIITPIIFGWFITKDSFINTTCFVVLLTLAELVFASFLHQKKTVSKSFRLRSLLALAFRRKTIRLSFKIEFFRGIVFDALDVLIVLYVIYMFKTNLNLGIFTSVFALCSILISFIFGRFVRFHSFLPILSVCSLLTFAATTYFVIDTSRFSFILYNFIFATATQLIRMIIDINFYKVSQNKSVSALYRAEYMSVRELVLNFGRMLGFCIVIAVSVFGKDELLKYLIFAFNGLIVFVGYMSLVLSKRLIARSL